MNDNVYCDQYSIIARNQVTNSTQRWKVLCQWWHIVLNLLIWLKAVNCGKCTVMWSSWLILIQPIKDDLERPDSLLIHLDPCGPIWTLLTHSDPFGSSLTHVECKKAIFFKWPEPDRYTVYNAEIFFVGSTHPVAPYIKSPTQNFKKIICGTP